MLSVIEFKSSEFSDDLKERKEKVFSVWSDRSDDGRSIHLLFTDTISVWECIEDLSVKYKPDVIKEDWEKYSAKLLNALQNNSNNASYEFKYCASAGNADNNDISITIKEEIAIGSSKKVLLKDFVLLKKQDSNCLQNFHETISRTLKVQNEKNNKYLYDKLNQAREIEDLKRHLQKASEEKVEYQAKITLKVLNSFNAKKWHQGNKNNDESDHDNGSNRDSESDEEEEVKVISKQDMPKKRSRIHSNNHNDKKRLAMVAFDGKTIVDEKKLANILASQGVNSHNLNSQSQSQLQSQSQTKGSTSAFKKWMQGDDDDDDDDLFKF